MLVLLELFSDEEFQYRKPTQLIPEEIFLKRRFVRATPIEWNCDE